MNSYEYRLVGGYQALEEHTATGRDFCLRDGNHGVVTQTTLIRTVSIMTNLVQQGILCAHCALPPAPDKAYVTSLRRALSPPSDRRKDNHSVGVLREACSYH
jgi:hypothetical protein